MDEDSRKMMTIYKTLHLRDGIDSKRQEKGEELKY